MAWTEEQVTDLLRYTADNWSAAQVVAKLNRDYRLDLSRNAVLGKLHRLKVGRPKKVKRRKTAPHARVAFTPRLRRLVTAVPEPEPGALPFTGDPAEIPPEQRRTLLDLNNHTCRYPYGDPSTPDFFFCGALEADCSGGRPYCGRHSTLVYHHPKPVSDAEQARRQQHGQWLSRVAARKRAAA